MGMAIEYKRTPRTWSFKRFKWFVKTAWRKARSWKRSLSCELRELDAFRKCARLERKAIDYPCAVPILEELLRIYQATGQEARRLEVMRRLRDIEPKPVPDFMWDEQPPVTVWRNNIDAWCAKIERLVRDRCMDTIHRLHIRNVLHVSYDTTMIVCEALEDRGILGAFDPATGRHLVLIDAANYRRFRHTTHSRKAAGCDQITARGG